MFRAIGRMLHWIWSGLDGLRKVLHLRAAARCCSASLWGVFSRPIPLVPGQRRAGHRPRGTDRRATDRRPARAGHRRKRCSQQPSRRCCATSSTPSRRPRTTTASARSTSTSAASERGGLAKLQEIAAAIDEFRATGKPVIAFGDYYEQGQYYLAAHADEIYLDPHGRGLRRRLRELRHVRQGRARQALDRREHLPRRPVQVRGRDVQPQRHVPRRAGGEPGLAQHRLGHVQVRRREGARVRPDSAAGLRRPGARRAAQRPAATSRRWRSTPASSPRSRVASRSSSASRRSPARTRTRTRSSAWTSTPTC